MSQASFEKKVNLIRKHVASGEIISFEEYKCAYLLQSVHFSDKRLEGWVKDTLNPDAKYLKPQWDSFVEAYAILDERQGVRTPPDVRRRMQEIGTRLLLVDPFAHVSKGVQLVEESIRGLVDLRQQLLLIEQGKFADGIRSSKPPKGEDPYMSPFVSGLLEAYHAGKDKVLGDLILGNLGKKPRKAK